MFGNKTQSTWDCISIWDRGSNRSRSEFGIGRSVFGIASLLGIEVQIEIGQNLRSVCQYLGSEFKKSVFGIEVEIEVDRIWD